MDTTETQAKIWHTKTQDENKHNTTQKGKKLSNTDSPQFFLGGPGAREG